MSTKNFKLGILTGLFVLAVFTISCEKEVLSDTISPESALKSAQVDAATDESEGIVEDAYVTEEGLAGRSVYEEDAYMPSCLTRTVVLSGLTRTVTLDFGTGCEMPNGNLVSGIITIVYEHDPTALSRTITYTYTDFTFNGIALSGGGSIVRLLYNANGNPQSTATVDVTATWEDGTYAHRTGVKVREWTEGYATADWTDNVFMVTGNWTTEFSNGDVNSGEVIVPLRRESTCPFFVSGVIEFTHNDAIGTLDFGDGTCDNVAVYTGPNGIEYTIQLGN